MHHQVSANCIGLDPQMCITAMSPAVNDSHPLWIITEFSVAWNLDRSRHRSRGNIIQYIQMWTQMNSYQPVQDTKPIHQMCRKKKQLSNKVFVEWRRYVTDAESSRSCQQGAWIENKCEAERDSGSSKRISFFTSVLFISHDGSIWEKFNFYYHTHTYIQVVTIKALPLKKIVCTTPLK